MNSDGANAIDVHLPPQNLEAERALLGAWLLDGRAIDECAEVVSPGDFYRDSHRAIAKAVYDMRDGGKRVDAVTLADELTRRKEYKGLGGDDTLLEISNAAPHAANARYHAQIVRQKAIARETIQTCTEVIRAGYEGLQTASELLDMAERRIFAISEAEASGGNVEAGDLMVESLLTIERRKTGQCRGLMTGFAEVDYVLDGFKPADLIILAARPSQGKTALALAIIAKACLERDASVLFASLEMNAAAIGDRLLSSWAGVYAEKLQRAWHLNDDDREKLAIAAEGLSTAKLTIDDRPNRTVTHVAANARRLKARRGLDLIVIDYLSLMDGQRRKGENRQEEVARLSVRLKGLARELNTPILCLHQLNRQSESREDRRPRLSDLRESGQIEQDADAVLLLHRPDYYDPNDQPGVAEVIVAKNRNGPTGTVRLMFRREYTRFEAMPVAGIPSGEF